MSQEMLDALSALGIKLESGANITLTEQDDGSIVISASGTGTKATQAEAEAGTENTAYMTALRTYEAVVKYGILRTAIEGHENDEFASYDNALFGGGYFPGSFCLFTGTTQPTDDTNAIGQPDIVTGSGVILFGDLRADSNPDASWTPEALDASDWPSGRVIHISPWHPYDPKAYLTVTLTSAAQKAGSGNGEHLWAQASWTEHGNVAAVQTEGDYFRFSENVPSQLDFDLPLEAMPALPSNYVKLDGSNITLNFKSDVQGANEDEALASFERVSYGLESGGDNRYSYNQGASNITFSVADDLDTVGSNDYKLNEAIKLRAWIQIGDHWEGEITGLQSRYTSQNRAQYRVTIQTIHGTVPAIGQTDTIEIVGEDVHRGQLRRGAYKAYPMNLLGSAAQQAFSSNTWTNYSGQEFNDNDLIMLCMSPTETGYGQQVCIRFGDVGTTGGQIHTSGFSGRRNGSDYQIQRTSGSATLYVRIFVIGNNSS